MSSDRRGGRRAATILMLALVPTVAAAEMAPERFSGERAMEWLHAQCDLGPRPPGSAALEELRQMIERHAADLGLRCQRVCFEASDPLSGQPLEICNLIVSTVPTDGARLWLGAHYDTRPIADRDPDPANRDQPILGANDGASGVAVLLHLMELLAESPPERGVDLLFFDGEDSGPAGDPDGFCLGSRHLASTWQDFSSPLAAGDPRALVLLDMVGKRGLSIGMEAYSSRFAPELTLAVFDRAMQLGLSAFEARPATPVYDDHVPFLEAGLPAVNLIDFDYPQWHTVEDTPEQCDPAALEQVGRLVVSLVYDRMPGF
ncbi:M28 family peptidase [bacterium]|nr:M28 family peptidase [bacterium]